MLGGPCSQHVTGNTSRQNQPQSAIMDFPDQTILFRITDKEWFTKYAFDFPMVIFVMTL